MNISEVIKQILSESLLKIENKKLNNTLNDLNAMNVVLSMLDASDSKKALESNKRSLAQLMKKFHVHIADIINSKNNLV